MNLLRNLLAICLLALVLVSTGSVPQSTEKTGAPVKVSKALERNEAPTVLVDAR